MWQALFEPLSQHNFVVLAVALDQADTAGPWIEAAKPTYPCLIDRDHHVADLFGLVNVPQAVWIDEDGRIVRPAEVAGSIDSLRSMDRTNGALPEAITAERKRVKALYMDAVADWAVNGTRSPHVMGPSQVRAQVHASSPHVAQAHAHFRLAQHLLREGHVDASRRHFDEASRLHPDSWPMWRQAAPKDSRGLAAGPDFWARVDALGERHFYAPIQMAGVNPGS